MNSMKKKVFITVKTYPNISTKYKELVCTAGIAEDGSWIRIYPIRFRKLSYSQQFKKYQWVELDLKRNEEDARPETFRPIDIDKISIGDSVKDWRVREGIIFKAKTYTDLDALILEAKNKSIATSLAIFKPTKILDFKITKEKERTWSPKKIAVMNQSSLFEDDKQKIIKKLPYKFSYVFEDVNGRKSTLMITDWEIGALYWKCLYRNKGNEKKACEDVKNKYFVEFSKKDLSFFLGTTKEHHFKYPNPFIIIGVYYPPKNNQMTLL